MMRSQESALDCLRLLYLDDQIGLGVDRFAAFHDGRTCVAVSFVTASDSKTRFPLDEHRMAGLNGLLYGKRSHPNPVLVDLQLPWNTNLHIDL